MGKVASVAQMFGMAIKSYRITGVTVPTLQLGEPERREVLSPIGLSGYYDTWRS